jgi:hypothetical protein
MKKSLGKAIVVSILTEVVVEGMIIGIDNKMKGKTFFGKPRKPKLKTRYNYWSKTLELGTKDYSVC